MERDAGRIRFSQHQFLGHLGSKIILIHFLTISSFNSTPRMYILAILQISYSCLLNLHWSVFHFGHFTEGALVNVINDFNVNKWLIGYFSVLNCQQCFAHIHLTWLSRAPVSVGGTPLYLYSFILSVSLANSLYYSITRHTKNLQVECYILRTCSVAEFYCLPYN